MSIEGYQGEGPSFPAKLDDNQFQSSFSAKNINTGHFGHLTIFDILLAILICVLETVIGTMNLRKIHL